MFGDDLSRYADDSASRGYVFDDNATGADGTVAADGDIFDDRYVRTYVDVVADYRRSSVVAADVEERADVDVVAYDRPRVYDHAHTMSDVKAVADTSFCRNLNIVFDGIVSVHQVSEKSERTFATSQTQPKAENVAVLTSSQHKELAHNVRFARTEVAAIVGFDVFYGLFQCIFFHLMWFYSLSNALIYFATSDMLPSFFD